MRRLGQPPQSFVIDLSDFDKHLELAIEAAEDATTTHDNVIFDYREIARKLKERRGKPPVLEIKRAKEDGWESWKGEPTCIRVEYPEDFIAFVEYVIELLFQEPTVTIGGSIIWDYRIDGARSFREMRDGLTCTPGHDA